MMKAIIITIVFATLIILFPFRSDGSARTIGNLTEKGIVVRNIDPSSGDESSELLKLVAAEFSGANIAVAGNLNFRHAIGKYSIFEYSSGGDGMMGAVIIATRGEERFELICTSAKSSFLDLYRRCRAKAHDISRGG